MLKINEVAEILNVSPRTVNRMIKNKVIPAYRFGYEYRIKEEDLKEYIEKAKI